MKRFSSTLPASTPILVSLCSLGISLAACNGSITDSGSGGAPAVGGLAPSGGASVGGASVGGASVGGGPSGGAPAGGGPASGGDTGSGGGDAYPPTWDTITSIVHYQGCGSSSCHNGEAKPRFYWDSPADDAALYTALTTSTSERCGSIPLVTPSDSAKSAFAKIVTVDAGGCEDFVEGGVATSIRMPFSCDQTENCLPQEMQDAIKGWIDAGAPHP